MKILVLDSGSGSDGGRVYEIDSFQNPRRRFSGKENRVGPLNCGDFSQELKKRRTEMTIIARFVTEKNRPGIHCGTRTVRTQGSALDVNDDEGFSSCEVRTRNSWATNVRIQPAQMNAALYRSRL